MLSIVLLCIFSVFCHVEQKFLWVLLRFIVFSHFSTFAFFMAFQCFFISGAFLLCGFYKNFHISTLCPYAKRHSNRLFLATDLSLCRSFFSHTCFSQAKQLCKNTFHRFFHLVGVTFQCMQDVGILNFFNCLWNIHTGDYFQRINEVKLF